LASLGRFSVSPITHRESREEKLICGVDAGHSPTTSLSATEPIIKPSTLRPSIVPPNADSRPTVAPISLRAASKRPARPREPAVAAAAAASPPSSPGEEDENGVKPLRPEWVKGLQALEAGNDVSRGFTTVEFRQFESIR
jgi:hypothetical protein